MSKTFGLFKSIMKILPERIVTLVVATSVVTVAVPTIKSENSALQDIHQSSFHGF
jgi:hypothetical protein